jgi:hypothetical protein
MNKHHQSSDPGGIRVRHRETEGRTRGRKPKLCKQAESTRDVGDGEPSAEIDLESSSTAGGGTEAVGRKKSPRAAQSQQPWVDQGIRDANVVCGGGRGGWRSALAY